MDRKMENEMETGIILCYTIGIMQKKMETIGIIGVIYGFTNKTSHRACITTVARRMQQVCSYVPYRLDSDCSAKDTIWGCMMPRCFLLDPNCYYRFIFLLSFSQVLDLLFFRHRLFFLTTGAGLLHNPICSGFRLEVGYGGYNLPSARKDFVERLSISQRQGLTPHLGPTSPTRQKTRLKRLHNKRKKAPNSPPMPQ